MKRRVVRPGIVTLFAVGLLAGSISSTASAEKVTVETLAEFDAGTGGIEVDAKGYVNKVADESSKGSKLAPTRVRRIRIKAARSAP